MEDANMLCRNIVFVVAMLVGFGNALARGEKTKELQAPSKCVVGLASKGDSLVLIDHCEPTIIFLNADTGEVIKKMRSPALRATGVAWDGRSLWVLDEVEKVIYKVDPENGSWTKRIEIEASRPRGLGFYKGSLYVADVMAMKIHEVDPSDGTTIRAFPAPCAGVSGLGFYKDVMFVANREEDAIFAIDHKDGWVFFYLPSPGPHPTGIATLGNRLVIADYETDKLTFHDMESGARFWVGKERKVEVVFKVSLFNFGPDVVKNAVVTLAVPETTENQTMVGDINFDPKPAEVVTDADGQRLARVQFASVAPNESAVATMSFKAVLRSVHYMVLPEDIKKGVSEKEMHEFLKDGSKLVIEDPKIQEAAQEIRRKSRDYYDIVRNTYRYVIDHMEYELAFGWNRAPLVLERGTGSCSEYSILMMALLRANKVPCRFVGTLVVRGDNASWDDVFHRFLEVFLPGVGFIPVDANKGDAKTPSDISKGFGVMENRYLVTTRSAGDSLYLNWTYNYVTSYECAGRCKVLEDAVAEFSPLND
jgi:hypothetical protein